MTEQTKDLKQRRIRAGTSQEELSRMARCSTASLRFFESGYRPARGSAALVRIEAILAAYETDEGVDTAA